MTRPDPVPPIPERKPRMALRYRALSAGFGAAEAVLPRDWPGLSVRAVEAKAGVAVEGAAREGLARLIEALARETRLSLFGRISVRYDLTRLARNRATIELMHAENAAIGAAAVASPLFILGLPRSGTTFLHTLLAHDPDVMVPRNWQTLYPAPRPRDFDPRRSAAARRTDRQLATFAGLAPEFPLVHPIHADSPQECSEITAHVFQSLRFDTTFRVPSYLAWLDEFGHDDAFAFHKRFLQAMQYGVGAKFWALKCPDHTFSMDAILRVYPDARFVIVHRDPVHVFASVAHLTEVLRRPFLRETDPAEIGAQVTARWIDGARRLVGFDRRADIAPARKLHIHYDELTADPMAAIATLYRRFGAVLSPEAEAAMRGFLAARPRGGYGRNRYRLADFGINPERLRPKFAPYMEYFGVKPRAKGNTAAI
ncbi:sulfotransferase [Acidiphilium sp. AL]|uniref:Sulfotransferase n=1 Tax=Acidiphilium iwatense TaxID=768198 RepID=A0ABS9DUC5_9PROT|nr:MULTISPECIES: sulfotransferase [Acidiphilium]MCF3946324.1 sulfotransferase [Acidiphilium iwatense]MCU4159892.1 sulfotransferase [Acidiphilium sp. AL]